jgi:hypothetical protein
MAGRRVKLREHRETTRASRNGGRERWGDPASEQGRAKPHRDLGEEALRTLGQRGGMEP